MKKILYTMLVVLISSGCARQGTGSTEKGFRYEPGDLTSSKYSEPATSYDITFNGPQTGNYAVIVIQTINDVSYVGIAVSDSPAAVSYDADPETFSMKIFYRGSSITSGETTAAMGPAGDTIDADECRILINDDGSSYTYNGGDDVSFSYTDNDDGTWNITMTGTPAFDGASLSITTLKARKL